MDTVGRLRRVGIVGLAAMVVLTGQALDRHPDPEPVNLEMEVARIAKMPFERDPDTPVVVFTGSSSIRLWKNLNRSFPRAQAVNTGFGGSTMRSLLQHADVLINRFSPELVIIHEGDNDIAAGRSADEIILDTKSLVRTVRDNSPRTHITLISAKPSPARWRYQQIYRELNERYQDLAHRRRHVSYVDVWSQMLDDAGYPRGELFREDELHMNKAGYAVWRKAIAAYVPTPPPVADRSGGSD